MRLNIYCWYINFYPVCIVSVFTLMTLSYTISIEGRAITMTRKTGMKVLIVVAVLILAFCFTGCRSGKRASLKAGCYITEAYHYSPDGIRCHCMVIAGIAPGDDPYLHVKNIRIEQINGDTCTIVYEISGMDGLYVSYDYPLSNLNY